MGTYREFAPTPWLQPLAETVWTHAASEDCVAVLPDTCMDIVWTRAAGLRVVGTMTRPVKVSSSAETFIGLRFRAGAIRCLLDVPCAELKNQVASLAEFWGKRATALERRMQEATRVEELAGLLQSAFSGVRTLSPVQRSL